MNSPGETALVQLIQKWIRSRASYKVLQIVLTEAATAGVL